ncbi:MAG: hypothetical protein R2787_03110 [Saprospiraceae bacterium]
MRTSGIRLAYDACTVPANESCPHILPEAHCLHCDENPGLSTDKAPEYHRNLTDLSELLATTGQFGAGLT